NFHVTGVQTCALPISLEDYQAWKRKFDELGTSGATTTDMVNIMDRPALAKEDELELWIPLSIAFVLGSGAGVVILLLFDRLDDQIGRASWRERVVVGW